MFSIINMINGNEMTWIPMSSILPSCAKPLVWVCLCSVEVRDFHHQEWSLEVQVSNSKQIYPQSDSQSEALAVFKSLGSHVSKNMGYRKCCAGPIHTVLPQLGLGFGPKSEKVWETWNHLLPIITWNNLQDTPIFVWALSIPFHSWWANSAKLCIFFTLLYVFGKGVKLRI